MIFASGRTDSGVHAENQVANFKCETALSEEEILNYLNHYLPKDILVKKIEQVPERFHSRLNAVSKTYEYSIAVKKPDVFIRKYVFETDRTLDVLKMRSAAELFIGKHDFKPFSSVGKTKKSTERTVNFIDISENDGLVKIKINANGFLYNMVRIIAGTLFEIGTGEKSKEEIEHIFKEGKRENAGFTAKPEGLYLEKIFYNS